MWGVGGEGGECEEWGEREEVDVTPLRSRRAAEMERLRETNRRLEREVGVRSGEEA